MINTEILKKIFKSNNIEYELNFILIHKKKYIIHILYSNFYSENLKTLKQCCEQRKNCWIIKKDEYDKNYNILFNEDYIQSIIRQKLLNTLLND